MASKLCEGKRLLLLLMGAILILPHSTTVHGASAGNFSLALPNCPEKCGNMSIPYPFGIGKDSLGKDCFLKKDFEVICNTSQQAPTIYINTGGGSVPYSKVLNFSLLDGEARIQNTIHWSCKYQNSSNIKKNEYPALSLNLGNSLKVSYTKNKFTAIGCATIANIVGSTDEIIDLNNLHYTSACSSFCDSDLRISRGPNCDGLGCCQTSLPPRLSAFYFGFFYYDDLLNNPSAQGFSPCSYAFVVEVSEFKFDRSYAEYSNFQKQDGVPLVLDWSVGSETCEEAKKNSSSFACRALNSVCINATNGSGYRCICSQGYQGNPYLDEGCQDINECDDPSIYPCINGNCINTIGSYNCSCPGGTESKDPKNIACTPVSDTNKQPQVKVVIGVSVSFVFLIVCISSLLIMCQKRKLAKEKETFFRQNGGPILYQNILNKRIDTVRIFTIEDLKKATSNFDRSRELGKGGHGTVYKGILEDNKEVAVKRSKNTNLMQTEEFVQEIIILSQVNHKNVIRLLGCCLEVEVPILVYEFIPNGTLFQLIHENHDRQPVSLEDRLRIAQESAEALEYLHLSINRPIVHGDVKSLNILLDNNCMAKVTDFGASRMLPKDAVQFMTMVQGTIGYLDPEYLQERKLTEKSDVYSFGVVLLELITRKTAIYFEGDEMGKNLATSFLKALKDDRVQSMLDTSIMYAGTEELFQEVAELASQCLSMKGSERPSMTQVADKLKAIRSTWSGILLLKHEETQRLAEQLGTDSVVGELSPSMYWTARHLGLDIETPRVDHAGSTNML
ncbi:unnamed protein product [Miscanthus lutarioriparius]|uniref:Uncharacterized protein n=1 Tax=Miscanthus lutarioriparius TaxID=422564 RepID=A0A811SAI4_9POAL|nr:unnamed protein product [Miscanthus lutarioriparius]